MTIKSIHTYIIMMMAAVSTSVAPIDYNNIQDTFANIIINLIKPVSIETKMVTGDLQTNNSAFNKITKYVSSDNFNRIAAMLSIKAKSCMIDEKK